MRLRIEAPPETWDRLLGELHELGTQGVEERESDALLVAYFSSDFSREAELRARLSPLAQVRVGPLELLPDEDWEALWRSGLQPRRIGPLWVRPSWCPSLGLPELEIDPEQAFGSGEHATTRLALRLLLEELRPGDTLLDVGSGSGILALGALRLGARRACGVEHERAACRNARANARRNRLALGLVCGTLDALEPRGRFDLVVANLLLGEVEPLLPRLAAHAGRALVLSGYLEREAPRVDRALSALALVTVRQHFEPQTGDVWGARLSVHARALQSASSASSVSSNE